MVQALAAAAAAKKLGQSSAPPQPLQAKGWGSIPPIGRNVIIIGGTGLVLVGGYFLVKYFNDRAKEREEKKTAQDAKSEYEKLEKQGKTLSKPKSAYGSVANVIEKLLDGCDSTASEIEAIKNIIGVVKKPIDWAYLKATFGVRKIDDCGIGSGNTEYDLGGLLGDQLDTFMIYDFVVDGQRYKGTAQESIDILKGYFNKIGVSM